MAINLPILSNNIRVTLPLKIIISLQTSSWVDSGGLGPSAILHFGRVGLTDLFEGHCRSYFFNYVK